MSNARDFVSLFARRFGLRFDWRSRLVVLGCALVLGASSARAGQPDAPEDDRYRGVCCPGFSDIPPRPQDQVWLVSTRSLGCPSSEETAPPRLDVQRYDPSRGWETGTLEEFYGTDDAQVITVVWVDGNRVDPQAAIHRGSVVYHQLVRAAPDEVPIRYVIWSWPSTRVRGQLRDVRAKFWRTELDGYYLAWFLANVQPDAPVSLAGFSFGPRIITGALHLMGGGTLAGRQLPAGVLSQRRPVQLVLMSAAQDNGGLLPGRYHGKALSQVDKMLVLYNSCDPVLKRYRLVTRCSRPEALGYTGMGCPDQLGDVRHRVTEQDLRCMIGKAHDWREFVCNESIMSQVRRYMFALQL